MDPIKKITKNVVDELTGWKNAATTRSVSKSNTGSGRSRGQFAKSYPLGHQLDDPKEGPPEDVTFVISDKDIDEQIEPDVDPDKLPDDPEEAGYNEDGFELDGRFEFQGIPISIENAAGSYREWGDTNTDEHGTTEMLCHYGYVEDTEGVDGDSVDVYVGPDSSSEWAYVVHQMKKPGFEEFDEDKCMLGFSSEDEAKNAYLAHYNDSRFYGGMSSMPMEKFKEKVKNKSKKITNESKINELLNNKLIDKTLADNTKLLKTKKNIDVTSLQRLGHGYMGVAFALSNKIVLKVTSDQAEAKSSWRLKNKAPNGLKHVVVVYDVWAFKDVRLWGIIEERLQPLSQQEKNDLFDIQSLRFKPAFRHAASVGDPIIAEDIIRKGFNQDREGLGDELAETMKKFNIFDMMQELSSIGVLFTDYHGDNIMKRNGEYVVIDLGVSQGAEGEKVPVLESLTTMMLETLGDDLFGDMDIPTDNAGKDPVVIRSLMPEDPEEARQLIFSFKDKLLKRSIDTSTAKILGAGSFGTAFDIGNNRVLKVTGDASEASSSNLIKGKQTRHVVRIYDAFRFPGMHVFGILMEKLTPLTKKEQDEFMEASISTGVYDYEEAYHSGWAAFVKASSEKDSDIKYGEMEKDEAIGILKSYQVDKILDELKSLGIKFSDLHGENMMKRGSDFVVIDLGMSKSAGIEPPVLEKIVEDVISQLSILEKKTQADLIALVVGKLQPPDKNDCNAIRKLASKFTKVVIALEKGEPFSYDLRREIIGASLADIENKLEVHIAEVKGQNSTYVPGIVDDMGKTKDSPSITDEASVNVFVSKGFHSEAKEQIRRAPDNGFDTPIVLENSIAIDGDKTKLLKALKEDNRDAVKKLMDSLVESNDEKFEELYVKMKGLNEDSSTSTSQTKTKTGEEAYGGKISLTSVGIENIKNTLAMNAGRLKELKAIDVEDMEPLGHGEMGIAYDIGNNMVFKVTTDAAEAKSSNAIIGKKLDHVVRIYDVFRFGKAPTGVNLFGIKQEKLSPLNDNEVGMIKRSHELIGSKTNDAYKSQELFDALYDADWDRFKDELFAEVKDEIDAGGDIDIPKGSAAYNERLRSAAHRKFSFLMAIFNKLQLQQMMADLKSSGIKFGDYHKGNIMKRGNDFVVIDLGLSQSNGPEPDVFENITKQIVKELTSAGFGSTAGSGMRAGTSPWSSAMRRYTDDELEKVPDDE